MALEHKFKFEKGIEVQDVVTKFKGVIAWRVDFLTGCAQYGVQPPVDEKGEVPASKQFDENQLIKIGEGIVLPDDMPKEVPKKRTPGGPAKNVGTQRNTVHK
jgi:hypothetical protein